MTQDRMGRGKVSYGLGNGGVEGGRKARKSRARQPQKVNSPSSLSSTSCLALTLSPSHF